MTDPRADAPEILITPLTFLQTLQSGSAVMSAMLENDATYQEWFGPSRFWRSLVQRSTLPMYYHLITSGYTASVNDQMAGWLFVRGRRQLVYIETLVTRSAWRRKGVARALLRFAETLAKELQRRWLGLTVTLANLPAVRLYEKEGYQRGHWQTLAVPPDAKLDSFGSPPRLKPVWGLAAERAYHRFTEADIIGARDWDADPAWRMIPYSPYRQWGRGWVVEIGGKPAGYLSKRWARGQECVYMACPPAYHATPEMLSAALSVFAGGGPKVIRLANRVHHEAARKEWAGRGLIERPADTALMFKSIA